MYSKFVNLKYVIPILCLGILPLFLHGNYMLHLLIMCLIWLILSSSLNLIMGYAGGASLGHGALYGLGAYTSAILVTTLHYPVWLSILIAIIVTTIAGAIVGAIALRTKGIYFAIVTLGVGAVVYEIFDKSINLTGGPMGIRGIPYPENIGPFVIDSKLAFFYLFVIISALVVFLICRLVHSRFGETLIAIREDDVLSKAMGINLTRYKIVAFCFSSGIAGLAGALYAHYITYISPNLFTVATSFDILVITIVGGAGTIYGPIVGAFLLTLLPEALRVSADFRMMGYAVLLLLIIIFWPEGIVGFVKHKWKAYWSQKRALAQINK